jgi:hypothetical protein
MTTHMILRSLAVVAALIAAGLWFYASTIHIPTALHVVDIRADGSGLVEWHPGELYPRVGFIVTNMSRPSENVVAFYNKRGTCEQWIYGKPRRVHIATLVLSVA